jgi:hypothetical protein
LPHKAGEWGRRGAAHALGVQLGDGEVAGAFYAADEGAPIRGIVEADRVHAGLDSGELALSSSGEPGDEASPKPPRGEPSRRRNSNSPSSTSILSVGLPPRSIEGISTRLTAIDQRSYLRA